MIGLVGRGIQASRTPGMHEREAARLGLGYSYLLLDFDRLGLPDEAIADAVLARRRLGFRGLNVTHPFKQSVIAALDDLSPEAQAIGAVNTVVFDGGRSAGAQHRQLGLCARAFARGWPALPIDRVVVFGAGGAGAAVAYALMELGVGRLSVIDSDERARRRDGAAHRAPFPEQLEACRNAAGPFATPMESSTPRRSEWRNIPARLSTRRCSRRDKWVADIIYFPAETELLRSPCDRLPHAARHRHGDLSGRPRL